MRIRGPLVAALVAALAVTVPSLASPPIPTPPTPPAVPAVAGHQPLLSWGGQVWAVQAAGTTPNGGPTTDSASSIWVDATGALHLKILSLPTGQAGPSLTALMNPGYGTYSWTVDRSSIARMDPSAVLGLFLYSSTQTDSPSTRKREIDIENSKFGAAYVPVNTQFVVQPYWVPGHFNHFNVGPGSGTVTERFTWTSGQVTFEEFSGPTLTARSLIRRFSYAGGDVPPAAGGNTLDMNLWMYDGQPVRGSREVVIRSFSYTPAPGQLLRR